MSRLASIVILVLSLSLAGQSAPLQERPAPKTLGHSSSILVDEPRLDQPISVSTPHLPLGALLEQVSAETGVELTTDDRLAPISGYEVTAVVHHRPARELLDSLALLYSTRTDRWHWVKQRRKDRTRYVLRNSQSPDAVLETQDKELRSYLLNLHRQMKDFYSSSGSQRAIAARANPLFQAINDPRHFQRSAGFFSFISNLSEADLLNIMGGQSLEIPTASLTSAQREFIRREFEMTNPRSPTGEPLPGPDQLEKVRLFFLEDTMYLGLGAVGGHGVLGGIWAEQALKDRYRQDWLISGGETEAPDQIVPVAEEKPTPTELQVKKTTTGTLLRRLGRFGRINLLFDCPPEARSSRASRDFTLAGPLPEVLANLERQLVVWKRSGPFLLFRRPDWPRCNYRAAVPWSLLRELRATASDNGGYLHPEHWQRLANLNRTQLDYLSVEFPDSSQVLQMQLVLRLAGAMSERERSLISRPQGAQYGDWSAETWKRLQVLFTPSEARRVRFLLQWQTDGDVPKLRLHFGPTDLPLRPVERLFQKHQPEKEEAPL